MHWIYHNAILVLNSAAVLAVYFGTGNVGLTFATAFGLSSMHVAALGIIRSIRQPIK